MAEQPWITGYSYGCEHTDNGTPIKPLPYRVAAERKLCRTEQHAAVEAERRLALLGATAVRDLPGAAPRAALTEALPWSRFLPVGELPTLADDLVAGLRATAATGFLAPFANALATWQATAELLASGAHADADRHGPYTTGRAELTCPEEYRHGHRSGDGPKLAGPDLATVWDRLLAEQPERAGDIWCELQYDPLMLDCRRTPLRGALRTVAIDGRELEQWVYRDAAGLRFRYAVDTVERETWVTGIGELPAELQDELDAQELPCPGGSASDRACDCWDAPPPGTSEGWVPGNWAPGSWVPATPAAAILPPPDRRA
ncbi:hypothetical protein ACGF13_34920 [Kitasatospora sp. NPDC048286]|uniref:hypothetical protein n=1 Tax=Kitasatospora sp. NPDC048286 TaxID=3364047 RepID=UPI00371CB0D4